MNRDKGKKKGITNQKGSGTRGVPHRRPRPRPKLKQQVGTSTMPDHNREPAKAGSVASAVGYRTAPGVAAPKPTRPQEGTIALTALDGPFCPMHFQDRRTYLAPIMTNGAGDELLECLSCGYRAVYRVASRKFEPHPGDASGPWQPPICLSVQTVVTPLGG